MNNSKDRYEKDFSFYNNHLKSALVPLKQSNTLPIYKKASEFLISDKKNPSIMDIGCGAGQFAQLLYKKGYRRYLGVDFASRLVFLAKKRVPSYEFLVTNIFDNSVIDRFEFFDVIVCLEVLEHIDKDREFLSRIPTGKTVVFSVPNYFSESHVRAFKNKKQVVERYGDLLRIEKEYFKKSDKKCNHLFVGKNNDPEKRLDYTRIFLFKSIKK